MHTARLAIGFTFALTLGSTSAIAQGYWQDLGYGSYGPGTKGRLAMMPCAAGHHVTATLHGGTPNGTGLLVIGLRQAVFPNPAGAGSIVPSLDLTIPFALDGWSHGGLTLRAPGELDGVRLYAQAAWVESPFLALSNAVSVVCSFDPCARRVDPLPPLAAQPPVSEGADATDVDLSEWIKLYMNGELSASAMDVLLTEFKTHDLSYWVRHIKYIHAFGEMYEASCDPSVFARWLHFNQILYTHRADRQTPPAMDTRRGNIVPPAWMFRWVKVSPEHLHAEVAINGVYGYSLAWWARHVVENPDLHARYGKIAVDYTNTVLEMLEFFNTRDLLSKYENNHPDPTYSYWSVSESAPEPFNIVHLLAKAMLETHRVLRSPYYRNHSGRDTKRMAEQTALLPAIVSGLHRRFMFRTRTIGQTLLWPYSEARAGWDDASHGGITAHYYTLLFRERDAINAHLATRNQVALSSTDMSRIARTFVENVYREGGQRPGLRQLIDGTDWPTNHEKYDWYSGDTFPWLQLSPFDQDVLPRAEHVATTTNTKSGSREFFHYECHTGLLRFKHHRGFNVQIARFGRYAWGGLRQAYETTANVLVGDFNGDRRHDLLRVDSRGWSLAAGATDHWRKIGPAGVPFSELLVGDFDGDGRDDLLHANPTTGWRISDGATGNWRRVGSSGYAAREFRVVDFDGDGRADLFQATGTEWRVSYSDGTSMTGWVYTGGSSALHAELALGDFNGDGVTDIFNVANGRGRVSWGRRGRGTGNEHSSWVNYATCPYGIADILVGDFNKDGKDDLLAIGTSAWWVSLSGTSTWTSWSTVAARGDSAASLRIGDFDGDGADDALRFEQRR